MRLPMKKERSLMDYYSTATKPVNVNENLSQVLTNI